MFDVYALQYIALPLYSRTYALPVWTGMDGVHWTLSSLLNRETLERTQYSIFDTFLLMLRKADRVPHTGTQIVGFPRLYSAIEDAFEFFSGFLRSHSRVHGRYTGGPVALDARAIYRPFHWRCAYDLWPPHTLQTAVFAG